MKRPRGTRGESFEASRLRDPSRGHQTVRVHAACQGVGTFCACPDELTSGGGAVGVGRFLSDEFLIWP